MEIIFNFNDSMRALLGGALIGLSASLLMLFKGRIAGISGIVHGIFFSKDNGKAWRLVFILGLVFGGYLSFYFLDNPFHTELTFSNSQFIIAGLLVGIGTKVGNGCTSGHGVCGISRFSMRSIFATLVFIGSGVLTVFLMRSM